MSDAIKVCDYVVAFIDLLGQRAAMPSRHLSENYDDAIKEIKQSVGRIIRVQSDFERFYKSFSSKTGIFSVFPDVAQNSLPDMAPGELKWQPFSDGLVVYAPLGNGMIQSPINSIFGLLTASAMLCLAGLAAMSPLRIGIDVAWAAEYRPNQLYGAALAFAYELESKVAQWPRVVVGDGLTSCLSHYAATQNEGLSGQYRASMASTCLGFIRSDIDGHTILDYLGSNFVAASEPDALNKLEAAAKRFVHQQHEHWKTAGDVLLEARYENLLTYFRENQRNKNSG